MTWLLFLSLNITTYSITILLQRVLVKESNSKPIAYSIFFQLFTGIFITAIALILGLITFPKISTQLAIYLGLGTCLYAFSNLFIFKALKIIEASKFTVLFSTRVFFTPSLLLAIIYPGEVKHIKLFVEKRTLINISLLAVVYGLANIGFFEALKLGPSSSLVTTIQLLSIITTVFLSILLLKENQELPKKIIGSLVSFVGLLLIL